MNEINPTCVQHALHSSSNIAMQRLVGEPFARRVPLDPANRIGAIGHVQNRLAIEHLVLCVPDWQSE